MLKVGDKVKLLIGINNFRSGDIGTVCHFREEGIYNYGVKVRGKLGLGLRECQRFTGEQLESIVVEIPNREHNSFLDLIKS